MGEGLNVILIGATGHIGAWVHRRLIENGHHVTACARKEKSLPKEMVKNTTWCTIDLSDMNSLQKAFASKRHDFFIHLASEKVIGNAEQDPAYAIEVNVCGTARVLAAASGAGLKRGIFASTWAVYTPNDVFSRKYKEDNELGPTTVYGDTKRIGEELCRTYIRGSIPELTILRFFNNVGGPAYPGATEQSGFFNYVKKAIENNSPVNIAGVDFSTPDGSCYRDFTAVGDVADLVSDLVSKRGKSGIYNIGSGVAHSLLEVVDAFESVTGKKIDRGVQGRRMGDQAYVCANIDRAIKELDFRPKQNLADMVRATMGT